VFTPRLHKIKASSRDFSWSHERNARSQKSKKVTDCADMPHIVGIVPPANGLNHDTRANERSAVGARARRVLAILVMRS
jgi:hypothetical protein